MSDSPLSFAIPAKTYFLPLETLGLSSTLFHTFQRAGISMVGQVLELDPEADERLPLEEMDIREVVQRIQELDLLEAAIQNVAPQPQKATSALGSAPGRRDHRQRPGRGKRRTTVSTAPIAREPHVCYKLSTTLLPDILRATLPRCTRHCYVQPFQLNASGELVEWRPGQEESGPYPDHFRVASTPRELVGAPIKVEQAHVSPCILQSPDGTAVLTLHDETEQRLRALATAFTNPAVPSFPVRVAPAYFLAGPSDVSDRSLQQMIAPGVSFPSLLSLDGVAHHVAQECGTPSAIPPKETGSVTIACPDNSAGEQPAFEKVYLQVSTITYEDKKLGHLTLVYVSPFVDRFDGCRSGSVDVLWLTGEQIEQTLPWKQLFERLDSFEARVQVSAYALAGGATPPEVKPAGEEEQEHERQHALLEEQYTLVPLKDPAATDVERALELYISNQDMAEAKARRESQTALVRRVIEQYLQHPTAQPIGVRLSQRLLQEIHYWLGKDLQKRRQELPRYAGHTISAKSALVLHPDYTYSLQQVQDKKTGQIKLEQVPQQTGYRVIVGVLALTGVADELIVHPRHGKPVFTAPPRPIVPCRTPNYVPIEQAA